MTNLDKMQCDFIVRYGNDNSVNRGFYDTYENAIKEYSSIKLDSNTTWKQLLWEPLDKLDVQKIIMEDSAKVLQMLDVHKTLASIIRKEGRH